MLFEFDTSSEFEANRGTGLGAWLSRTGTDNCRHTWDHHDTFHVIAAWVLSHLSRRKETPQKN